MLMIHSRGPSLPAAEADKTWTPEEWKGAISQFLEGEDREPVMQRLIDCAKLGECRLELRLTGTIQTVCGTLKPDVLLKLREYPISHSSVASIISIKSKSTGGCFDNNEDLGKTITYGQEFLTRAGASRDSIVVAIIDLVERIWWFRVSRSNHHSEDAISMNGFTVLQGERTLQVRESLCGYLQADPTSLGLKNSPNSIALPSGWRQVCHLGNGRTSNVYWVENSGFKYALKVPKRGYKLNRDIKYLTELRGIDGVPRLKTQIGLSLVLERVGELLTSMAVLPPLGGLVDILQHDHERQIVNKDIHLPNIMVAQNLHDTSLMQLYILDWGFAEHFGVDGEVCGALETASDDVLCQYSARKLCLVYKLEDDLISLVRCLFLLFFKQTNSMLMELQQCPEAVMFFWRRTMETRSLWQEAEGHAKHGRYADLKQQLNFLQQTLSV